MDNQLLISAQTSHNTSQRASMERWKQVLRRKVPILDWGMRYKVSWFVQDLLAGFTVGLTEIPQGIAYASVAGLPPEYGLYCGFMGCFMYCIFGSCKDINIGPTAIMALMAQPHIDKMGPGGALILTFLSGCVIFILGMLHLGFVVEFISYPVVAGFTCAAAMSIASSQFKGLFGLKGKANEFLESVIHLIENIGDTNKWDAILGFTSIIILVLMTELRRLGSMKTNPNLTPAQNRYKKAIWMISLARNALIVVVGTALAYILKENGETPFTLIDQVGEGLPPFKLPPFEITNNGTYYSFGKIIETFGSSLAFVPLVAILESVAIGKAFSKGKTLDATQELIALGVSNIMGSFVGSMPVTGSFTRTAVNNASGVRTPLGGVFTGSMVLLALGFLTSTFAYIPKATLASVVLVSMYYLFEFEAIATLWRTKKLDLVPFTVTFIAALFLGLEYGILIGIGVNLLFVLYLTARPKIEVKPEKLVQMRGDCLIVTPSTPYLMFPCAEFLRETVIQACERCTNNVSVIIDGSVIKFLDATVIKNLQILLDDLELKKHRLILWNFQESVLAELLRMDPRFAKHHHVGTKENILNDDQFEQVMINDDYTIQ
ncbi:sodium-independent sulfate anion transporter-like isoform X2 [Atheta coriaria]